MQGDEGPWLSLEGNYSGDGVKVLLEQYKIYVETSSKVSDRRGAANTFLMSVNTALVTVYGLIGGKEASLTGDEGSWKWLLPLAGVATCLAWFALIRSYRALNKAKFVVIDELERLLPARLFDKEWRQLERTFLHLQLTQVEQFVPAIFGAIYLILLAAAGLPQCG